MAASSNLAKFHRALPARMLLMVRPMQRFLLVMCVLGSMDGIGAAAPSRPAKKQTAYVGIHPLSGDVLCNIEDPHVHVQPPERADVLYRVHDGRYQFVGDPVPFGYDGPKHAYYGHHPVVFEESIDETFCYLDGPHFHVFEPPSVSFALRGGAYWYTGRWPKSYKDDARRYAKINVVYEPLLYTRPVVTVAPPEGYRPPVIDVVVKAARPRGVVTRPRFELYAPVIVVGAHYDDDYDLSYHRRGHKHRKHRHRHHRDDHDD